jgi:hypothetical protein
MPERRVSRWLLWCGVAGPILFVVAITVEGAIRPNYDSARMFASLLSLGDQGWQHDWPPTRGRAVLNQRPEAEREEDDQHPGAQEVGNLRLRRPSDRVFCLRPQVPIVWPPTMGDLLAGERSRDARLLCGGIRRSDGHGWTGQRGWLASARLARDRVRVDRNFGLTLYARADSG